MAAAASSNPVGDGGKISQVGEQHYYIKFKKENWNGHEVVRVAKFEPASSTKTNWKQDFREGFSSVTGSKTKYHYVKGLALASQSAQVMKEMLIKYENSGSMLSRLQNGRALKKLLGPK